jgi:alkylation response protein AidB-like acyl-CoA dehydrogenase
MNTRITYGEDQALLRDEARRWLSERASIEALREQLAELRGDDPAIWKELGELGWLGLTTPEQYGGAGLGCLDLATVAEETGRVLLPTPWLGHLLASTALVAGGSESQREAWLPRLARGELQAAWAHVEKTGAWRAAETRATWHAGRLRGEKTCVWGAATADLFCVPVTADGDLRVALVPAGASGVRVEAETTLDRTRRQGRLFLDDVPVDANALLERGAVEIEASLLPRAWLALAAESAGGASAALDMTAAYAATRKQFDRAIGSFQAIKHPLVNVLIQVEQTRSLVYAAASAIDQSADDAELLARMAKASASDAFVFAASRAIQFHGGYGFTEECDAHLYLRRAFASRAAFGDAGHHRARIADVLIR